MLYSECVGSVSAYERCFASHPLKSVGSSRHMMAAAAAPFLLELSEDELPPMRLLTAYRKLHLYAPRDLGYLLACKLMLGRPERDDADIAVLCQALAIQSRTQAQQIVDRYFPSPAQQAMYRLPRTLESVFGK